MADAPTFLDLMDSARAWFSGASWNAWRTVLAALSRVPLTDEQLTLFRACTGRTAPTDAPIRETWAIVGRRGGKSIIAAFVAVVLACYRTYTLAPGERGVVMILAADKLQARVAFHYVAGFVAQLPGLQGLVRRQTASAIDLVTGISIEIHTSSFRTVRGYTLVAAVCDEIGYWSSENSANPDTEVLAAIRPAMATVPNALLLCISSPYARRGALWAAYRAHWGQDGDPIFVWKAPTLTMNPCVDASIIRAAYEADESSADAEYGANFRRDVETYLSPEAIEAVVIPGRHELSRIPNVRYVGFCDPAGGSGADSMTVALAHAERRGDRTIAVLDLIREVKPPFSPEQVVAEFAATLQVYHVNQVVADRYAGDWPTEQFAKRGIACTPSERTKSEIYGALLPALNSGAVELLDDRRLLVQLGGLERRTSRGGKDSIDHGPHGHDDLINAAAGALGLALTISAFVGVPIGVSSDDDDEPVGGKYWLGLNPGGLPTRIPRNLR